MKLDEHIWSMKNVDLDMSQISSIVPRIDSHKPKWGIQTPVLFMLSIWYAGQLVHVPSEIYSW